MAQPLVLYPVRGGAKQKVVRKPLAGFGGERSPL
jgi:hypothetical protein